jgi:glycosyltransferase involved in cell wall biosynthesis
MAVPLAETRDRPAGGAAAPARERPADASSSVPDVSVIVPVHSPLAQLTDVVRSLSAELERLGRSYEFLLVFDGVRGRAWGEALELASAPGARVRTIGLQQTFGDSVCLSAGFEQAQGRVILTSPQYVQIDPHELGAMLAALEQGADFVTPWRHPRIDPYLNRVQSAFFNWLMRRVVHMRFHDLNCTFRALRREVLEELVLYGDMYRFLPVIAYRQGFRVVEVKVRHLQEWGGAGFFGAAVYARRLLDILGMVFLAKFTLRPLRFFGALGAMLILPGGLLAGTMTLQWLLGSEGLWGRPMFQIAFMAIILGVQIIGFGLVGEIIIFTQARNLREYRIERVYESRAVRQETPANGTDADDGDGDG